MLSQAQVKSPQTHFGLFLLDNISAKALKDVIMKELMQVKSFPSGSKPDASDNQWLAWHLRVTAHHRIREALKKAPPLACWGPICAMVTHLWRRSPNCSLFASDSILDAVE